MVQIGSRIARFEWGTTRRTFSCAKTLQAQNYSNRNFNFTSYVVAAVFFIFLTIPLARFTDHLIAVREARERAQAV